MAGWVGPAIQAVGSIAGGFLGSQGSSAGVKVPKWYKRSSKRLGALGEEYASRPYQGYGGERVAPFSEDTMAAFDLIRNNVGFGSEQYQNALNTAARLQNFQAPDVGAVDPTTWLQGSANIGQYMNPYTNQVINASMADLENQRQVQYNDLASAAQ